MTKANQTVLLILDAYGGQVSGKTMLQKVCFFADEVLDLDLAFKPHYYGPYSAAVEEALGELKALGFLEENSIGFGLYDPGKLGEVRRFDYRLTQDGRAVAEDLKRRKPKSREGISWLVQQMEESGNPDYVELSVAAKSYYILKKRNKAMTNSELKREAGKLGWSLSRDSIEKALGLLCQLRLTRTGSNQ